MRAVRLPILLLVLVLFAAGDGFSQSRRCYQILMDTTGNAIEMQEVRGKPGETIELGISLTNTVGVVAHQFLIDLDTTFFRPSVNYTDVFTEIDTIIVNIDSSVTPFDTTLSIDTAVATSTHYQYSTTSRYADTTMSVAVRDEQGTVIGFVDSLMPKLMVDVIADEDTPSPLASHVRLQAVGLPRDLFNLTPGILPGEGPILKIPFTIPATAQHLNFTYVDFYYAEVYRTDTVPNIYLGCKHNNFTDLTGISIRPAWDTLAVPIRLVVDTTDFPVVNSFTASPATISQGGSSVLSWDVAFASSVTISNVTGTFGAVDQVTVSPSVTTLYTLTGDNGAGSQVTDQVTVTVLPPGSNANPVVASVVPSSYTISQGGNVSFAVSATDADGDFITLSAVNLPTNATFGIGGQVTGTGNASGNFSFTPNTSQEGVYQVSFRAVDEKGGTSNTVTVSITVEAIKFDILFSSSNLDGSPVGGLAGKKSIMLPIDLVTAQTVYGVQFDFRYDHQYFDVDSIITTPRTQDWVIYENIGQTPGELRIVTFGMNNEPVMTDTTSNTAILYIAMSIDSTADWGDYPVYIEDGWESNNPDPTYPSLPLVTDSGIVQVDRRGDVNLDKRIDVADAVNIVASILGNVSLVERQSDVADVIVDLTVDVFDLVGVINMIYGIPVQPTPGSGLNTDMMATVALDYEDMFSGSSDVLMVRSELPEDIAGVQFDLRYDPSTVTLGKPETAVDADGLTLTYKNDGGGRMTVLMHFTNPFNQGQLIHSGVADLVTIPMTAQGDLEYGNGSQLKLSEVKLSTAAARQVDVDGFGPTVPNAFTLFQNYPNPFNPTTTIEFALDGGVQHVKLDIFNVLGQVVRNLVDEDLPAGLHSVEWDATSGSGGKVATGVYFYRLQSDDGSDTKKMLLLK